MYEQTLPSTDDAGDTFDYGYHEAALVDPMLTSALRRVREANEYLAKDETLTPVQVRNIVAQLDAVWPYMNQGVTATGALTYLNPLLQQSRRATLVDKALVSRGWNTEKVLHMRDGTTIGEYELSSTADNVIDPSRVEKVTHRLVHHLSLPPDEAGGDVVIYFAHPDEVMIEYGQESVEFIANRLHYAHADEMEFVDLMLASPSAEQRLMNVKAMSIGIDAQNEESIQFATDLTTYMTAKLGFDDELPYVCGVSGSVDRYDYTSGDRQEMMETRRTTPLLLSLHALKLNLKLRSKKKQPKDDALSHQITFDVIGSLHGRDPAHDGIPVIIALSSLKSCQSLRQMYFDSVTPKQEDKNE